MKASTVVDLAWLESATLADLKAALRVAAQLPDKLKELNALLATPEGQVIAQDMINDPDYIPVSKRVPNPEEAAQIAADKALADEQAVEASEAERLAAVAAPSTPPVVEEKKKIVVDYQATAEDGTPIGRPTHIEGWTNEEVIEKMKNAHINAVRYAERVKKNKVQSIENATQQREAQERVQASQKAADEAVEVAAKEKDPIKLREAISKVSKADRDAEIARQTAYQQGVIVADVWQADHKDDFQACDANGKIIGEWLKENNLALSYENLESAFAATKHRLAKPTYVAPAEELPASAAPNAPAAAPVASAAVAPLITATPAPTAAPVILPAAPDASPSAVAAPSPTSAAAPIAQLAARRPGVNGSLQPGSLTAERPSVPSTSAVSTSAEMKREIAKMPAEEYRKKLKNPEYVARLRAAGIPVVSQQNA